MNTKLYLKNKVSNRKTSNRKTLKVKPNGRSTDFIIPSFQIGCSVSCSYCNISRHRPFGNPIETYKNHTQIKAAIFNHYKQLPSKKIPNQTHSFLWTYDIGESTDCLSPEVIDITNNYINFFQKKLPRAMTSFATKLPANWKSLTEVKRNTARVRVSLCPQAVASYVEIGANNINKRLENINNLYSKGYEVHINLSPVIIHNNWLDSYRQLLTSLVKAVDTEVLNQIKYEIIFLTHHPFSFIENQKWNPEGEHFLWLPKLQETKKEDGTVRYKVEYKSYWAKQLKKVITEITPQCAVRYCF